MVSEHFKTVTSINGTFVRRGQDKISVFDNSLLYAEGLFETLLCIDDRILFLEEHLKRLYKGSKIMGLGIPVSKQILTQWMFSTAKKHPDRIKKLRLTVTSGEAARWVGSPGQQQVILSVSPHIMPAKPFTLNVSRFRVDQDSVFRQIKTISYVIHAAALNQAQKEGCDDALMLNEKNNVAEVSSANIFWVKNKKVFTPPLSSGCLEGTTRKIVMNEANKLGIQVLEKNCKLQTILKADETFLSSSLKLVVGISKIKNDKKTFTLSTGEITNVLANHFTKLVKLR